MSEPSRASFRDPRPAAERILQLAHRVLTGDILLPSFQRGFVWNRKQMLDLLDSIARNYPIGSILLWQSRQELKSERKIADLDVADSKPDYPVNYLLDGQQRLSTICGALYWTPSDPNSDWNIWYDLKTGKFFHADSVEDLPQSQIPVRSLSNPSTYFAQLVNLNPELVDRARGLFDRFTDYLVPTVTLGDMSIEDVAPVFERINSTGTRLTIVDLMRAATWTPTFDLVNAIDEVLDQLQPKRFHTVDRKTVLRIIAASAGKGFTAAGIDELRTLKEEELRSVVRSAGEAAKLAADFLTAEVGIPNAAALPYVNQFAVLTEIWRQVPNPSSAQYSAIRRWFWRTTLSSYFGGWNTGQMAADLDAISAFASGQAEEVTTTTILPSSSIWSAREFRSNSATSKMLAVMLAQAGPVDLITGQAIDADRSLSWANDKEFHHFFPRAYLRAQGVSPRRANSVANIILLTSASNLRIRDRAPAEYLADIKNEVGEGELVQRLERSLVSREAYEAAIANDYNAFLAARSADLQSRAVALAGYGKDIPQEPVAAAVDDSDVDPSE